MSIPEFAPKYCIHCGERAPPDYQDWQLGSDNSDTEFYACLDCLQFMESNKE